MRDIFLIITIVLSIVTVALILLQGRGAGLGSAWGGGGEFYQSRRGIEKITLQLTVAFVFCFLAISIANLFIK